MENFSIVILQSIWFLLPGYFANTIPVLVVKINFLNYPIDGGKTFRGKPIFGCNKTWRGFFFGILFAIVVSYIQSNLYKLGIISKEFGLVNYNQYNFILVGFLFGFGALIGDLVESFFKRKVGRESGTAWFPFDQIDFIIGILLFVSFIYVPTFLELIVVIVTGTVFTLLASYVGFFMKLKKTKI